MNSNLLLSLGVALVAVHLQRVDAACSDAQLKSIDGCYSAFVGGYGLPTKPLLPAYWQFHNLRTSWLDMGLENHGKIKALGRTFSDCINPNAECITTDLFKNRYDQNQTDAESYVSDYGITNYETTDRAYYLFMTHFYCMKRCGDAKEADLTACDNTFNTALAAGNKQSCNDNAACYRNVYSTCCGTEAGEYYCGVIYGDNTASYPLCKDMAQCQKA